ncbi:hypothetical protein [Bradyrhizobium sp. NAS80.1]|nr:hypothetical protein [Bradyrhizobium sp. NAS80.1]
MARGAFEFGRVDVLPAGERQRDPVDPEQRLEGRIVVAGSAAKSRLA